MLPEKHTTYYDIIDSFKEKGCPICFLVDRSVNAFFKSFLMEFVLNHNLTQKLNKSKGFCERHGFSLIKHGDSLATAITYNVLMDDLLAELKKTGAIKSSFFKKEGDCPACEAFNESDERYTDAFVLYAKDEELIEKYKKSTGVCVPHLRKILSKCKDKELLKQLTDIHLDFYGKLNNELISIIRKNDYRYSKEPWGNEKDAWIRAVEKFVGRQYKG
ncbi:MAG: hypothetical protein A2044_08200 [Candidatus Firestonebacteria bacterium GWA2_43_8]|nr:MAG: hypothetical protein A2044_08200 [Candidatus Firestonebacteria bacterium GWA2_43_8]